MSVCSYSLLSLSCSDTRWRKYYWQILCIKHYLFGKSVWEIQNCSIVYSDINIFSVFIWMELSVIYWHLMWCCSNADVLSNWSWCHLYLSLFSCCCRGWDFMFLLLKHLQFWNHTRSIGIPVRSLLEGRHTSKRSNC